MLSKYSFTHRILSTYGSLRAVRRILSIDLVTRARTRRVLLTTSGNEININNNGIIELSVYVKQGDKKLPWIMVYGPWQI